MPRKARDEKLDTRTARLRLSVRREPYWRSIQQGRALGYRRLPGGKAGTWIARHYDASNGRQYQALGSADDMLDADGSGTLTFAQAQTEAAIWFTELGRTSGRVVVPVTVSKAVEAYEADYAARGGKDPSALKVTFAAHILPALGDMLLMDLTASKIRTWHQALATAPIRVRAKANASKPATRKVDPKDKDAMRARRATSNRLLTSLKAALNHAFREGHIATDEAWRRVQPFASVDAARIRYLDEEEFKRLVNACPTDLRQLVIAALLTGCRYGELGKLLPSDINIAAGILTIRESKSAKPRHIMLTDEAKRFFEQVRAGKTGTALLLVRADGSAWGKSYQIRPLSVAYTAAKISPAISFHTLRHTYASRLAMLGVPMPVISAQLGHADTKITTKHYAHLSPSYVAAEVRAAFGDLGLVPDTNAKALRSEASE